MASVDTRDGQKTLMKSSESQTWQKQERRQSSENVRLPCGTVSVATEEQILPETECPLWFYQQVDVISWRQNLLERMAVIPEWCK